MKWLVRLLALIVAAVVLIGVIGWLLPVRHVAAVRITVRQPREQVFRVLADVRGAVRWRSDLKDVDIIEGAADPVRWREITQFGPLVMAREESKPPVRLINRIDDPTQPFSGRWIHDLEPVAGGTSLTITEEGEIENPYFRFFSRFVFGHYRTLETYARDLSTFLGERAEPVRVNAT